MSSPTLQPGRYLGFHLGSSHYAVPIRDVREVVRLCPVAHVPNMPAHVRGVMNLRGALRAVIDLRAKFGMEAIDYDDRACIVVFDTGGRPGSAPVGAIVDGVDDVLSLSAAQLAPPPEFPAEVDTRCLLGIASTPERVCAVLHMPEILAREGSLELPPLTTEAATGGNERP